MSLASRWPRVATSAGFSAWAAFCAAMPGDAATAAIARTRRPVRQSRGLGMVASPEPGLFLRVEESRHQRRPKRDRVRRADEEMAVVAERRHQVILGAAAGGSESRMHALR